MPGFIDPHSHFIMNGQTAMWVDMSDCESFGDIIKTLKEYQAKAGDKKAIIGFGYDHNFLKEGRHPDKRVLDQVSTVLPVFVLHVSVHFACGNSVVLKLAGLDDHTPDPEGGKFGRLEDGRELSGYFEETAMHVIFRRFSQGSSVITLEVAEKMQETYLRYGVTTTQDGATTPADMAALDQLAKAKALKMDVVAYPMMTDHGQETMRSNSAYVGAYQNHVKIGGYKLVLDGSPQGRSAWMSKPYLGGDPDYRAYPWMADEQVESYIETAKDAINRGLHVNFHQDTPVTKPDMMHSVWCAVNRVSRRGNVIGEDQKIDVYNALRAVTIEGAYEYFEEDSKGTIDVGKRADLVVLDKSPLDVPASEIRNIKVIETIKDGIIVYECVKKSL